MTVEALNQISSKRKGGKAPGWLRGAVVITVLGIAGAAQAKDPEGTEAFSIDGKKYTVEQLEKDNQANFYELEKQKYDLIQNLASQAYLDHFWADLAKKEKTTPDKARDNYLAKKAKLSDKEIKEAVDKFKDHPQLKDLSKEEVEKQVRNYLEAQKKQETVRTLLDEAAASKKFVITYPKPKEPVYEVKITDADVLRYGPKPSDTKAAGCKGNDCPIIVVEYSEFQCPFCERVQPSAKRLLEEYKGKVVWTVRDFPLGFHDRAKPAAIAAHCAREQGKFWEMYNILFENQRNLEDKDLSGYASKIGLDKKKYEACVKKPDEHLAKIEANYASGEKLGVTGTPAFFINGRRLSGALPYEEFKRVFDEELAAQKAGKKDGRG